MALSIVQHKSGVLTSQIPGTITLGSVPGASSLILLFLHCNIITTSITVNTAHWTVATAGTVLGGASNVDTLGQLLYTYGPTTGGSAVMAAPWTGGTTYWAYDIYEISGVSGTFATDVPLITTASSGNSNVSSLQPAALTSTVANAIGIIGAGQYDGSHNPTVNASYVADETQHNSSNYGSTASSNLAMASLASNGQPTVSFGGNIGPADAISVIVQLVGTSTETGTAVLGFGPLGFAAAGSAINEIGTAKLAFGPLAFSALGGREETATAVLGFGPIAIKAAGVDIPAAGRGIRQFWTR